MQGENLASIREAGYHWLVAAPQPERVCYFEQFEEQEGWSEILREPSPRNEGQQKMRVLLKPAHSPTILRGCLKSPDSVKFVDYVPHSSFQTAGVNPTPRTVSLELQGLFKHALRS